ASEPLALVVAGERAGGHSERVLLHLPFHGPAPDEVTELLDLRAGLGHLHLGGGLGSPLLLHLLFLALRDERHRETGQDGGRGLRELHQLLPYPPETAKFYVRGPGPTTGILPIDPGDRRANVRMVSYLGYPFADESVLKPCMGAGWKAWWGFACLLAAAGSAAGQQTGSPDIKPDIHITRIAPPIVVDGD